MFHISPHQRRDVIFPALFSSRLSTQFVEKHERLQRSPRSRAGAEKPGRRAGAGRTPCRGWGGGTRGQKQKRPDASVALVVVLPGPQTLLPAGWELLLKVRRQRRGPFVARAPVAARGAQGHPQAAVSAGDLPARGRGSEGRGTTAEKPLRGGCDGTEVT